VRAARGWLKAAAAAGVALAVGPQTQGCARGRGARSVAGVRGDGRDETVGHHGRGGSAGRVGPHGVVDPVDGRDGRDGRGVDELDRASTWTPTPLSGYRADFDLRWRGHLAGRAREELIAGIRGGYRFSRRESWRVARGGSVLEWETEIVIDADRELRGERVWLYRDRRLRGSARRARAGWTIEVPGESVRGAPAAAEPVELVPLRLAMRREARWAGPVLLAGFELAVARLTVEPDSLPGARASRRRVVLSGPGGRIESRVQLRADGTLDSEAGPDASQVRVAGADPRDAPGEPPPGEAPPDLVALGAIPVSGRPPRRRERGSRVAIAIAIEPERGAAGARRLALAPPPDLPGQRVRAAPAGWLVELGVPAPPAARAAAPREPAPRMPPRPGATRAWPPPAIPDPVPDPALRALADRVAARAGAAPLDQLRALARYTAVSIDGDLSRGAVTAAGEVLAAGRADCVGHAALFSALARARGFDLRLVTGYRLDGGVLARHMWAVVAVGGALVAIDPTRGEAPAAPGRLLGLAVHGSAPAEIALAAELAFAGLSGARARYAAE